MNLNRIKKLFETGSDSCYIFKKESLIENINDFNASFKSQYSNFKIAYSYKTNFLPFSCITAYEHGVLSEVVSEMELDLAKKMKIKPKDIIYNGPIKTTESLRYCLLNESYLNVDNLRELENIRKIAAEYPEKTFNIGVRINLDLNDGFKSRFGFDAEMSSFNEFISAVKSSKNINLIGLHTHSTRPDKSVEAYIKKMELLINIAKDLNIIESIEYLDIGGGFYGRMDDNMKSQFSNENIVSIEEYGTHLGALMKSNFPKENVELIVEPGLALCVNTIDFICRIDNIREIQGEKVATCTGSFHNVKPTGHKKNLSLEVFSESDKGDISKYDIAGYTCLENDILYNGYEGALNEGDYLLFKNVGAYTFVFKPPFIKLAPPFAMFNEDSIKILKKDDEVEDIFKSYKF